MIRNVLVVTLLGIFLALIVFGISQQLLYGEVGISRTIIPTPVTTLTLPETQETAVAVASLPPTNTPAAPSSSLATPSPTSQTGPQTHTIQPGETLFSIARRYNISLDILAAANNIFNPNLIQVGQTLIVPNPADTANQTINPSGAIVPTEPAILPAPAALNGIPLTSIIVMPEDVKNNARQIFAQGQAMGRNAHAYSKVGDSTIQNPFFMARFDQPGGYQLGEFAYLQPAVDYFLSSHGREGMAVRQGLHSWTVTDPMWADKAICQANETPIACEIRLHNPAILLIRLGSNDSGVPEMFNNNVRQVVELAIANGIIPVIGTKADRFEGSNINNEILRQIAAEYQIPLWDFDVAAQMIPGRGLDVDGVHLTTFYAHDYGSPVTFQRGHGVHNLTALMMLNTLLEEVILPASE